MLNKYDIKSQRHVLPRPAEQAIQQRLNAIADHTAASSQWVDWLEATSGTGLHVDVQFLDAPKPSRLSRQWQWWVLEMSMSVSDYADLAPGPEVTLRFVQTIEAALLKCHKGLTAAPPETLRRTKRETAWLADGHADPGPGTDNAVRIARPPTPMPEPRFWDLISRTTSPTTGAFRLGWQQADRFTSRMRLLIEALDDPAHAKAAEEVLGFVSQDVWEDTRAWVVSLGPDMYKAILDDAQQLTKRLRELDSEDDIGQAEALLYLTGGD